MDINEKLDRIAGLLEQVIETQQDQQEQLDEVKEAVQNVSSSGRDYDIFSPEA